VLVPNYTEASAAAAGFMENSYNACVQHVLPTPVPQPSAVCALRCIQFRNSLVGPLCPPMPLPVDVSLRLLTLALRGLYSIF